MTNVFEGQAAAFDAARKMTEEATKPVYEMLKGNDMTKSFYENPDVSKVLSMYEEYRQFIITTNNQIQKLVNEQVTANQKFLEDYQKNMKEYLDKVKEDTAA
jgi:hypothetical protein